MPAERVERDWTEPYQHHPGVVEVLKIIYEHPDQYWAAYEVSERLVDIEINFQSWRFHHMKTVERIIGSKTGSGGTSGVKVLEEGARYRLLPRSSSRSARRSVDGISRRVGRFDERIGSRTSPNELSAIRASPSLRQRIFAPSS